MRYTALSIICIIVVSLLSSCTTDKGIHRPELEFVVAEDPEDTSRKCIIGTYPGTDRMTQRYTEKILPDFENELPIGTPVCPIKVTCTDCSTEIWKTSHPNDDLWESQVVSYKIVARALSGDKEA